MSTPIKLVEYRLPVVTVEDEVSTSGMPFGGKFVKADGKVVITVHYVYPWTDNHSVNALAQKIASMFRGDEPEAIEPSPAPVQPQAEPVALQRWGRGTSTAYFLEQMQDGYWTPWHIAQEDLNFALASAAGAATVAQADKLDAERYRWLRSIGSEQLNIMGHYAGLAMDKEIDAAMKGSL